MSAKFYSSLLILILMIGAFDVPDASLLVWYVCEVGGTILICRVSRRTVHT